MLIRIYKNSEWVTITNYVVADSVTIQSRHDDAFATGSLQAWLIGDEWKYNIPPYTPISIDGTQYVCSSKVTKYQSINDTYIHDIDVLESTAILSCFVIGSKYFSVTGSNKLDSEKVNILTSLVFQKYGVILNRSDSFDLNEEIEYNFKSGSTLYDCLSEIAHHYNRRVFVNFIDAGEIYFVFKGTDSFEINESRIISQSISQNVDQYGAILETEAKNVVDRTTVTEVRCLTCRSDDVLLNNDTAKIMLPTNVEDIVDFGMDQDYAYGSIRIFLYGVTGVTTLGSSAANYTYSYISNVIRKSDVNILDKFWNECLSQKVYNMSRESFYAKKWRYHPVNLPDGSGTQDTTQCWIESGPISSNAETNESIYMDASISLMSRLKEKSQYELLTPQDQATYAVYTSGGRTIENLNSSYKKDIWNVAIGVSRSNFLESYSGGIELSGCVIQLIGPLTVSSIPMNNKYYCKYHAICDPVLYDKSNATQLDGRDIKNYSRTYGNGASLIDFDKVITGLKMTNDSEGLPELQIEYDCKGITVPKARQYFTFLNVTWYISSVITTYGIESQKSVINCVRDANKIADCIGTESDYTSIKNDLSTVIDRPLLFVSNQSITIYSKDRIFFRMVIDNRTFFIPCAVMIKDSVAYLYAEAYNQSALMPYRESGNQWGTIESNYKQVFASYTNSNNECRTVKIQVVRTNDMTTEQAYLLPNFSGNYTALTNEISKTVYKDARERLTFTFIVKIL